MKKKKKTKGIGETLTKLYYTPSSSGSFGGIDALYRAIKDAGGRIAASKSDVERWLQKQDTYSLHKQVTHRFPRRQVIVGGIDHQWQVDLVDVPRISCYNDGFKFILMCIDVFSKYTWAVPLINKTGAILVAAFTKILAESNRSL